MLLSGKKQKTVVGFCLTRKNAAESVPLAILCVYDLEETGGSECGAGARTPTKRVCAEQARRPWGPGGRPGAHPGGQRGGSPCRPGGGQERLPEAERSSRLDRVVLQGTVHHLWQYSGAFISLILALGYKSLLLLSSSKCLLRTKPYVLTSHVLIGKPSLMES